MCPLFRPGHFLRVLSIVYTRMLTIGNSLEGLIALTSAPLSGPPRKLTAPKWLGELHVHCLAGTAHPAGNLDDPQGRVVLGVWSRRHADDQQQAKSIQEYVESRLSQLQ